MSKKVTEIEKLKYWVDSEFSILHAMFAIVMLQVTHGWLPTLIFTVYLIITVLYTLTRLTYLASIDKDYLRIPKK